MVERYGRSERLRAKITSIRGRQANSAQVPMRRRVDHHTLAELAESGIDVGSVVFAIAEIDLLTEEIDLQRPSSEGPIYPISESDMWTIADTIAANLRPCDVVYVTEANEFGLFIKDVTLAQAADVVARVSAAVNRKFPRGGTETLALSVGTSEVLDANDMIYEARSDLRSRRRADR